VAEQNPNEPAEGREPEVPRTGADAVEAAGAAGATGAAAASGTASAAAGAAGAADAAAQGAVPTGATPPDHTAPDAEDEIWVYEESDGDAGPNTGVVATFLPGVDAGAVIALFLSALAAGVYLLVSPLVQAKAGAASWANYKNKVPQAKQDPFATERFWAEYQSWGHIILGLAAILVALLVLGLWTYQKNKLWSRSVAQAALVIGLAVVIYGILMKTGAIGGNLPSTKTIQDVYTQISSSGAQ
jgi:hypothetical protein